MKSEKLKNSNDGSTKNGLGSIILEYDASTHSHFVCHNATYIDELDKIYNFYDCNDAIEDTSIKDTKKKNDRHVLSGNKMLSWSTMNQLNLQTMKLKNFWKKKRQQQEVVVAAAMRTMHIAYLILKTNM